MPLRLKLFLSISLFFTVALSFFGYMAYNAAVEAGTAREMKLLQDLSMGLSKDLKNDIGLAPDGATIKKWLAEFDSMHLSIMVASGKQIWLSNTARNDLPSKVKHQIMSADKTGMISVDKQFFVWDTSAVAGTSYTLSVIHRTDVHEAHVFFKRLTVPIFIAALFILWVAAWSTQYVAALLEKLHAQKDRLKHQAMHDALTNLPNRSLMLDRLRAAMLEVDQSESELALLFIDLNHFKEINDNLGHHCGDMFLVELSKRLLKVLRKSDMVARLGGDEFAVILSHVNDREARNIAEKINQVIGQAIEIEDNILSVSGSIGIARYPTQATDAKTLVQYADTAMYAAKRSGGGCFVYEPALRQAESGQVK